MAAAGRLWQAFKLHGLSGRVDLTIIDNKSPAEFVRQFGRRCDDALAEPVIITRRLRPPIRHVVCDVPRAGQAEVNRPEARG